MRFSCPWKGKTFSMTRRRRRRRPRNRSLAATRSPWSGARDGRHAASLPPLHGFIHPRRPYPAGTNRSGADFLRVSANSHAHSPTDFGALTGQTLTSKLGKCRPHASPAPNPTGQNSPLPVQHKKKKKKKKKFFYYYICYLFIGEIF